MSKIEYLWAYVCDENGTGDEGIVSHSMELFGKPMMMPLIGADLNRMESFRPIARSIARSTGKKIKLIQFMTRKDLGDA